MGRRRGYKLTNSEASKCKWNEPCPRCKSQQTCVSGASFGSYTGCHECGKEWGWCDVRGSRVSHAEYQKRAEKSAAKWRTKSARSWALDAPGEGSDMAKKKAAKKGKKTMPERVKRTAAKAPKGAKDGKTLRQLKDAAKTAKVPLYYYMSREQLVESLKSSAQAVKIAAAVKKQRISAYGSLTGNKPAKKPAKRVKKS